SSSLHLLHLHSFPTRRSSDLCNLCGRTKSKMFFACTRTISRTGDSAIERSVALDRRGITVFRDMTILAAGPAGESSHSAAETERSEERRVGKEWGSGGGPYQQ